MHFVAGSRISAVKSYILVLCVQIDGAHITTACGNPDAQSAILKEKCVTLVSVM